MNALKQRWQSGCLGKALIIGGALFACMICAAVSSLVSGPSDMGKLETPTVVVARATVRKAEIPINVATNAPAPTKPPQPTDTPKPTDTPEPPATNTPVPTVAPAPTNTPRPQPKPTVATGVLPGLMPADIKVNLQNRDFSCADVEQVESYYAWTCTRETDSVQLTVTFYAKTPLTVDFINAVAVQFDEPSDEVSLPFLGFMATMPYDGAQSDAARAWVEKTVPTIKENGDIREATFGGVPYQVFGWPAARSLQFGSMK